MAFVAPAHSTRDSGFFSTRPENRAIGLFGTTRIAEIQRYAQTLEKQGVSSPADPDAFHVGVPAETNEELRTEPAELPSDSVKAGVERIVSEKATPRLVAEYRRLGSYRERDKNWEIWRRNAKSSPAVLIGLARHDTNIERLAHVSELLARLGPAAALVMVSQLEKNELSPLLTETLLRGLRWSTWLRRLDASRIISILERLRLSPDLDVREGVYELAGRLNNPEGHRFLETALASESDQDLRSAILESVDGLGG